MSPWVQHVPERGGYTFWSTDFHIAPIADVRDVFRSLCDAHGLCHTVEEHSFSGACAKTFGGRASSCARGLRDQQGQRRPVRAGPARAARAAPRLPDAYRGPGSALQHVDAFVCNHPPALCELYMPFNKSIVVVASVNLEFGRENRRRWREWLRSLRAIAADPRNVVAANNLYDAEYIRYYAGVQAEYVPSFCGYVSAFRYAPRAGKPVLLARNHNNPAKLYARSPPPPPPSGRRTASAAASREPSAPRRSASCGPRTRTRAASSTRSSRRTRRSSSCRTPNR